MGTELQPGQTLMEYTGNKSGISTVRSSSNKRINGELVRYRYGGAERLIPVWDEDVRHMESIGFRRAMAAPEPAPALTAPTIPSFAAERAASAAQPVDYGTSDQPLTRAQVEAMPGGEPPAPEVADVAQIEGMFSQDALTRHTEAKAEAAKQTVRGRPGRKPKG